MLIYQNFVNLFLNSAMISTRKEWLPFIPLFSLYLLLWIRHPSCNGVLTYVCLCFRQCIFRNSQSWSVDFLSKGAILNHTTSSFIPDPRAIYSAANVQHYDVYRTFFHWLQINDSKSYPKPQNHPLSNQFASSSTWTVKSYPWSSEAALCIALYI